MPDTVVSLKELAIEYKTFNYAIRAIWNGLYKANIICENNILFDETLKAGAEDYAFNLEYLKHVGKIGLVEYPIYKHFARVRQSASVGYNENRQKGIVKDYHTETNILKYLDISPETFVNHQLWYFYMMIREYCFEDTVIDNKEIVKRLKLFRDGMDDFKHITFKDKISLFRRMPKSTIKWEMLCRKHVGILFDQYKRKHG